MIFNRSSLSFFRQRIRNYGVILILALYLYATYILDFAMAGKGMFLVMGDTMLGPQNRMIFNITVILAVLCAVQGYHFLHSEAKSVFYLGLPMKRTSLFGCNYMCGLLIAMVPCIISRIICFCLSDSERAGYYLLTGILINLLGFLLVYQLVILIMVLTGSLLYAVPGVLLAFLYGVYGIGFVTNKYCDAFFDAYYRIDLVEKIKTYLSPGHLYAALAGVNDYVAYDNWTINARVGHLIAALAAVVLTGAAAIILFHRRPAESFGKVLAFKNSRIILKVLILIPGSLIIGYYLMLASPGGRSVWLLVIGIAGAAFLINGILEMIYQADLRAVTAKRNQAAVLGAVSILIAGSFIADIWKYDDYIPDPQTVKEVAVSVSGLEDLYTSAVTEDYAADKRFSLMHLQGKDKENVIQWLKTIQEQTDADPLTYVTMAFKEKGDRTIYRRYKLVDMEQLDGFTDIYRSHDYKQGTIDLAVEEEAGGQVFTWSNGAETKRLAFEREETQELLDCYQRDLQGLDLAMVKAAGQPIGLLELSRRSDREGRRGYIYPSFSKTIGYLKDKGIDADKTIADYEITRIEISDENGKSRSVDEPDEIMQLGDAMIYDQLYINQTIQPASEESFTVELKDNSKKIYTLVSCKRSR